VIAARQACHSLDIPHVTLDLRDAFRRTVVEPFVQGYASGRTPNPCTRCNGGFRFAELLAFARRAGARRLATGHYARIVERGGALLLARGRDERKDQSYMLASLDPALLAGVWFPLGGSSKAEVRAEAAAAGLAAAGRAESQEACFLAGDDYRVFLERRGLERQTGPIVDHAGTRLGSHDGHWRFTPGQRRGLGVAAGRPLYAIATDPASNTVVVGAREELARTSLVATGRLYAPVERGDVKIRYRSAPVSGRIAKVPTGFTAQLDEPVYGAAPGQTAVVYEDDVVVGAGTLLQTL
jgi:tRNA-specific 2-thiouridylase